MKGLGFDINVVPLATGVHIDLRDASGVTFVCYEDGGAQNITIKESILGASEQALTAVKELYAASGVAAMVWTKETTDANGSIADGDAAIVKKDTTAFDAAAFYIGADQLSAGFNCVEVTIDGAGICFAIVHGLKTQRAPANLPTIAIASA